LSFSWVMVDETKHHAFIPLAGERTLYTSPPRVSFSLSSVGHANTSSPTSIKGKDGVVFVTNKRVIFLPTNPTANFSSFSSNLTTITDSHVTSPLFGPNAFICTIRSVPGGNLNPENAEFEVKMVFKEGGTFEFQAELMNAKELAIYAAEDAGEELPAYGWGEQHSNGDFQPPPPPPPDGPPPGYEEAQMAGLNQGLGQH
ncbi:hypothetical protein DFH27DRAFT_477256, partial [Peziza echinospora]